MKNPLDALKALWKDPKKRPYLLAGGGAAGAAAFFTLRPPVGPEAAAEDAAAESATSPPPDGAHGAYGAEVAGGGMHGVYVTSPPMDYDSGWEEMDFSPLHDTIEQQGLAFEGALATEIKAERQARNRAVKPLKKSVSTLQRQNKRQDEKIQRQRQSLRKQRQQLARMKRRGRQGPKKKGGR